MVYYSVNPADADVGLIFQYYSSGTNTSAKLGFMGYNAKDNKFRLYSSTNRTVDQVVADNIYLSRLILKIQDYYLILIKLVHF